MNSRRTVEKFAVVCGMGYIKQTKKATWVWRTAERKTVHQVLSNLLRYGAITKLSEIMLALDWIELCGQSRPGVVRSDEWHDKCLKFHAQMRWLKHDGLQ